MSAVRKHPMLDAHWIAHKLWQGGYPRLRAPALKNPDLLRDLGFAAIVLCAQEHQPDASVFAGLEVTRAPLDDDPSRPVTDAEWAIAQKAAWRAAAVRRGHGRVLVTCRAGLNRSGLVTVSLMKLLAPHVPVPTLVARVRKARSGALFNQQFVDALETRLA